MSENKTHVKTINMFAKKYTSKSCILAEISNFPILNFQDPGKSLNGSKSTLSLIALHRVKVDYAPKEEA